MNQQVPLADVVININNLRVNQIIYSYIDEGSGYFRFFRIVNIDEGMVTLEPMAAVSRSNRTFQRYAWTNSYRPAFIICKDWRNSLILCLGHFGVLRSRELTISVHPRRDSYCDINDDGRYDEFTILSKTAFSRLWSVWNQEDVEVYTATNWYPGPEWESEAPAWDRFDSGIPDDFDTIEELE